MVNCQFTDCDGLVTYLQINPSNMRSLGRGKVWPRPVRISGFAAAASIADADISCAAGVRLDLGSSFRDSYYSTL